MSKTGFIQDELGTKKRKLQNTLVLTGGGTILFGVWSIAKFGAYQLIDHSYLKNMLEQYGLPDIPHALLFAYIGAFAILAADLLIRAFIGLSAIRQGRGKSAGKAYLVFSIILLAGSAYMILASLLPVHGVFAKIETALSLVLEFSDFAILLELFIAGIRLKKLTLKHANGKD